MPPTAAPGLLEIEGRIESGAFRQRMQGVCRVFASAYGSKGSMFLSADYSNVSSARFTSPRGTPSSPAIAFKCSRHVVNLGCMILDQSTEDWDPVI